MFWVRLQDIILFYAIILVLIAWIVIMCLLYNLFKEDEEKVNGHDSIKNVNKNINKRIDKEAKRYFKNMCKLEKKVFVWTKDDKK